MRGFGQEYCGKSMVSASSVSIQSVIRVLYWVSVFLAFFLSYVRAGFFPPANYVSVLMFLFLVVAILYNCLPHLLHNHLFLFFLVIATIAGLTLLLHGQSAPDVTFRLLKSILVGMVLSLSAYLVVYTYGLRSAVIPILLCASVSASVAIFQSLNVDFFWDLREFFKYGGDQTVQSQIESRSRIPGMAFYSITLSYQLLTALSLCVVGLVYYKFNFDSSKYERKKGKWWALIIVLVSIGLLLTGARSSYVALLLPLIFVGRTRWTVLFISVLLGLVFLNQDIYDRIISLDLGGRILTNITAVNVMYQNPFGLGGGSYIEAVLDGGYEKYSLTYPHNHFLTAAISFGIVPVLLYLTYNFVLSLRVLQLPRYYRYAVLFTIFAYLTNTLFHNAGMMLGEQMGWYLFGIIEGILAVHTRQTILNRNEV